MVGCTTEHEKRVFNERELVRVLVENIPLKEAGNSAVYTIDYDWFEEDGAVFGFTGLLVDHGYEGSAQVCN